MIIVVQRVFQTICNFLFIEAFVFITAERNVLMSTQLTTGLPTAQQSMTQVCATSSITKCTFYGGW